MSDDIDIVIRVKDSASGPTKEITRSLKGLDDQAESASSRGVAGLQKAIGVGLKAAIAVGTAAIIGFGSVIGGSIMKAADMEQGVANIAASMGLTADETIKVKDLIADLGLDPQLKVTATEAAQAIEVLGTAGLDVTEILDGAAESTVLLANSTGGDFAQSGKIATDVMAQFGIEAKDMADAVDQITGVTIASKFGITDYQNALAQAGGVAGSVGVDFDDFNAVIAATASSFNSGGDAGTSFKTFLTTLLPKSAEAADVMRELGLYTGLTGKEFDDAQGKINKVKEKISELDPTSKNYTQRLSELREEQAELTSKMVEGGSAFFDAGGNMRDMSEIAGALQTAFGGLTEAQKLDAAQTLFGADAMRTALALADGGPEIINEMKAAIGNTSAEEAAATRMNTFSGAMEIALGVVDTISMSIGDKFLPVLRPLVEKFTELAQVYGPKVVDFFGGVADKVGAFINVLIPGSIEVTKISGAIADTSGILSDLNTTSEEAAALMTGFADALGSPGQAAGETIRALLEIKDSTVSFSGSIIKLVTQFFSWKDVVIGVGGVLLTMFMPALQLAVGAIGSFLVAAAPVIALFASLVAASALLRNAWETDFLGIRTSLLQAWGVITGVIDSVRVKILEIVATFQEQWAMLTSINATLGEKLGLVWTTIGAAAETIWQGIVETVTALYPPFVAKLQEWGNAAWQWIQDTIPVAIAKLQEWGGALRGWMTANLPIWIDNLKGWGIAAWEWIVDVTPVVLTKLREWGTALLGWLRDNLPNFLKTIFEWGTALYTWIGDAIPKAIDGLTNFIKGIREQGDGEGKNNLVEMAGGWATTLWKWIRNDLIPAVGPAFLDFIKSMMTYGGKLLVSIGGLAKELGLLLWEWIVDITPVALKKIGEWGGELWGWIKENAPAWGTHLGAWAKAAWEWLVEVTPIVIGKLGEWGRALWEWVKENAPIWRKNLEEWGAIAWKWITEVAIPEAKKKLIEWGTMLLDWVDENWPIWRKNLEEAGKEMIKGLQDGAEIMWIRFTDWFFSDTAFGGVVGDILSMLGVQLGPAYGVLYKDGERIAYSLNDGSRNGLDSLRQTGSDMGSSITSGLRENLDMHSPSRVMWGYGEDILAGLQGGVRSGIAGLKSEMQYVADTIKATMQQANNEMLAGIEYFTNQALIKAQAAHTKIANAAIDVGKILKQLGIDTSNSIGLGPNGELILPGVNKLPKTTNQPVKPSDSTSVVPEVKDFTSIGEALGLDKVTAQTQGTSLNLLGGITLQTADLKTGKENLKVATEQATKTAEDFIGGFVDFLKGTLEGAGSVFNFFKIKEETAYREGELQKYIGSETAQTKVELKGLYQGIQNSIADLLGISSSDLNVTSGDSLRLIDRVKQVLAGTTIDSNMEFVGSLLQDLVNFRTLANTGTGKGYFDTTLPTDSRLTGGNTTNTYSINLMGTSNPSADIMSTVQLLNQLQVTAP